MSSNLSTRSLRADVSHVPNLPPTGFSWREAFRQARALARFDLAPAPEPKSYPGIKPSPIPPVEHRLRTNTRPGRRGIVRHPRGNGFSRG